MRKNATVGLFTTRLANVVKNYQLVGSVFHRAERILNDFVRALLELIYDYLGYLLTHSIFFYCLKVLKYSFDLGGQNLYDLMMVVSSSRDHNQLILYHVSYQHQLDGVYTLFCC